MKFRKKPEVIEATQFTEALRDAIVLDDAKCPDGVLLSSASFHRADRKVRNSTFYIETPEGSTAVEVGDWIVTDVNGKRYSCMPDIFEATYEAVEVLS